MDIRNYTSSPAPSSGRNPWIKRINDRRVERNVEAEFDLTYYDIIAVSSSGGKDSECALDVTYCTAEKQGVTDRIVVIHADLGRVEWEGSKEIAAAQAAYFDVPFIAAFRSKDGQRQGLLEHVVAKHNANLVNFDPIEVEIRDENGKKTGEKYPTTVSGAAATGKRAPWFGVGILRYCTSDHKRGPISTVYTAMADKWREETGLQRPCRILEVCGMRAGESSERAKLQPFTEQPKNKAWSSNQQISQWLPIHHWKSSCDPKFDAATDTDDVWDNIHKKELPYHHAYDLGMPRLSCVFCPYQNREAMPLAARHNPTLLNEYCDVEAYTGYTFTPKISLTEIRDGLQIEPADAEPVAVASWTM